MCEWATPACSRPDRSSCRMAASSAGASTIASAPSWCSRRCASSRRAGPAPATVTAVATTREEISYTGGGARTSASDLEAVAALVVDVTHATDYPGLDKRKHGEYRLGGGPTIGRGASLSTMVSDQLIEAAEAEKIPYTIEAASRDTHTDAEAIFNSHRGVATGLVSVPLRYMHSPNEMVLIEDVENTARLLAAFCRRVRKEMDFIPR